MKLDLSGIDLDQFNNQQQQPGQQERQQQLAQELQELCRENMKMEPQQEQYYAQQQQQDQMNVEGGRIGGNMNHQEREHHQSGGYGIAYPVKQEVMGTSPINVGYPPTSDSSGRQHKMTVRGCHFNNAFSDSLGGYYVGASSV